MRKLVAGIAAMSLAAGLPLALSASAVAAPAPAEDSIAASSSGAFSDDLASPLETKRRDLKNRALSGVINGEYATQQINGSTVVNLGGAADPTARGGGEHRDKFVELSNERTDKIFVILAEFGNQRHPSYPDQDTDPNTPGPVVFDGPLVNQIPQPDRTVDNSTNWQPDYSQAYFQNLYFGTGKGVESLKTYYETQSSGRYSVDGTVSNWVKVPYNEARYGRSNGFPCAGTVCSNTWALIRDAANQWVADQQAAGRSDADIAAELASFDVYDRYDYDNDGNFNEPDGYIDHFQIVHAGGDQADGDPWQGEDAIWSHRWYSYSNLIGSAGPATNPLGGTQLGGTGIWIGDYTIQPENGGRSVFFHEFGHDLGLPDDYDTAGGQGNSMEWWSLMAQSRLSAKGEQSIGDRAGDIGAWEKLQLGWLSYETANAGDNKKLTLGPEEYNTDKPQSMIVVLPKKEVSVDLGTPFDGTKQWYSGAGDDYTATLSRDITLPAGPAELSMQARWNIEDCGPDPCDYAFVEVDDGSGFTAIAGSITNAAEGNGIDGYVAAWTPATFDLSAYAGKTITLRVRYTTDGAAQGTDPNQPSGIFLDAITVTAGGGTVFTDDAENAPNGWTADGFATVAGQLVNSYDNYYIVVHRTYVSYDRYLRTGPYNFGFNPDKPDWVEHFSYLPGVVITYWDLSQTDNNVSVHPGEGRNLNFDANPGTLLKSDGTPWRTRVQIYDAAFTTEKSKSFTLHFNNVASVIPGHKGQSVFDDTKNYFDPVQVDHGIYGANAGVKIKVLWEKGTSAKIHLTPVS